MKKLKKSDLKKPLPKGLNPQEVRKALLKRIKKIQSTKSLTQSKKPGKSMAMRGQAGTNFALLKIKKLAQMNSKHALNNEVATNLYRVFERARQAELEFEQRPGSDHQILVNATNRLLDAEKKNRMVELTQREMDVISKYSR
jgi:hypothetical protein